MGLVFLEVVHLILRIRTDPELHSNSGIEVYIYIFTFLVLLIFLKFYINVRYLWFYIMAVSDEKFFLTPLVWECYALWTQTFLTLSLDYWQRELEYASTLRNTQGDHATPKLKLLNLVLICFPKTLQLRDNIFSTFFSSYNFFFMPT